MQSVLASRDESSAQEVSRPRKLQLLGIVCGLTAGAWLGAAEAPTKLVAVGLSPIVISLVMVMGVFLARWSLPALGNNVRPLPQSLPLGNESALLRNVFHSWRTRDDGCPRGRLSRSGPSLAGINPDAGRSLLVDVWWIHLGNWRCVPAICGEV